MFSEYLTLSLGSPPWPSSIEFSPYLSIQVSTTVLPYVIFILDEIAWLLYNNENFGRHYVLFAIVFPHPTQCLSQKKNHQWIKKNNNFHVHVEE